MYDATGRLGWSSITYKYDYDKSGNYIKVVKYYGGVPEEITEREIKYYE